MRTQTTRFGWRSADVPGSCNYITPAIIQILSRTESDSRKLRILDIGSGNGFLCFQLSKLGHEIIGLEPDKDGFEISKNKYPSIKFYNLGVDTDPSDLFEENKDLFDAVISTEVIEHLFFPHQLPQLANKVLKDNGHLIISTPYHGYIKNLALAIMNKWDFHHHPLKEGGHIKFWSRHTLTQLLRDNGFKVIQFHGLGRVPYLWKSMVLVAQKIHNETVL